MAKIRVYELARELKMESKVLLTKMKALGIHVPSHQSTLTAAQIEKIRANEGVDKPTVVVRRRRKADEGQASEAGEEVAGQEQPIAVAALASQPPPPLDADLAPDDGHADEEAEESTPLELEDEAVEVSAAEVDEEVLEEPAVAEPLLGPPVVEAPVRLAALAPPLEEVSEKKKVEVIEALARQAEERERLRKEAGERSPSGHDEGHAPSDEGGRSPKKKERSLQDASVEVVRKAADAGLARDKDAKRPIKRKVFAGATIVRRATPEETQALKAKEEARQRTSRREDSRGVRVTGIGVSTRMSEHGPAGGGPEEREVRATLSPEDAELANKLARERREKARIKEEEERIKAIPQPGAKKRLSTRDLLGVVESDEDETASAIATANRKRRTVYTPNAPKNRRETRRRKDLKATNITMPRAAYRVVKMESATISVGELAKQLAVKSGELIKKLMSQGVMATLNQGVDFDTATLLASEYGFEVKNVAKTVEDVLQRAGEGDHELFHRAPIITVMGHVDHGKTSILDAIRQANVASGESGGITQHIGAYMVERNGAKMTFLDTPGHEAFSAMRSRGARLTDIVVLVVAADDGVMPQTLEAISHAQNARVPIIVAVNKMDKPGINLDRIYNELSEHGVQAEDWGGDIQFVKVSALKRTGLEELLDAIHLQSEMLELRTRTEGRAEGVVIEGHLEKGRGPVATVMVTKGTLRIGDFLVAGTVTGKVRAMSDHKGQQPKEAGPSTPVEVIGLTAVPMSGDSVHVVADERTGKEAADLRRVQLEAQQGSTSAAASLEELLDRVQAAEVPDVPLIVKADTQGSVEAILAALEKLNSKRVRTTIVHRAVGGINESDVNLAATSGAVIIGFNVRAASSLFDQAEKRGVVVRYFSIIYDLVDAVKNLMAGELPPICTEVIQGHAEVRNAISVPKIGTVAGSAVTDGKITRSSHLRLIRDKVVIYKGRIGSLRRFKDDVREVQHGYECGIAIEGYTDVRVGDVIEAFMIEETAATLDMDV